MIPEDRGNQPTSPQAQPGQHPAQGPTRSSRHASGQTPPAYQYKTPPADRYHYDRPQPAYRPGPQLQPDPAVKKSAKPALLWGGLAVLAVAAVLVAALVVIPFFNPATRSGTDPFGVAKNIPSAMVTVPVSGTVAAANPAGAPLTGTTAQAQATTPVKGAPAKAVSKGEFTKIDPTHYARGTATLGVGNDGQKVLRFENFTSAQGPDLKVYLGARPDGSRIKEDGLNLGALPATDGSYNIILPDDLDLSKYKSVVIWCEAFSLPFSVASLS